MGETQSKPMRIASYADNLKATENCIQGLHQPPLPQANGLYSICKENAWCVCMWSGVFPALSTLVVYTACSSADS